MDNPNHPHHSARSRDSRGTPDLSVVIVNYNTRDLLKGCLDSLFRTTVGLTLETYVVDNGSTDGSKEMLEVDFPQVHAIYNAHNRGFAAANNQAIRTSAGKYILLLNSDTVVLGEAVLKTIHFIEDHQGASIVGCKLLNPDGSSQPSCRGFPGLWNVFAESFFLYKLFPGSRLFGRYYFTSFDHSYSREVDWVMGAFLLFHRVVIDSIGLLDEQFFMFGEETDFCFRARQAGFPTWFVADAEVIHYMGGSSESSYRRLLWTKGSQMLFFQKYFHGMRKLLLHGMLIIGVAIRIPVYVLFGIVTLNSAMILKAARYAVLSVALPIRFAQHRIYSGKST